MAASWYSSDNFRNRLGFAILGLTNNFAYVVMLSAAKDLLAEPAKTLLSNDQLATTTASSNPIVLPLSTAIGANSTGQPYCNPHSTATILLADTIPSLTIKFIFPFLLVSLPLAYKTIATALLAALAFIITGLTAELVLIFTGVICASLSSGVGEASFLSSTPLYGDVSLSGWSIGTGGAGLVGAGVYAILSEFMEIKTIMLVMLMVPVAMLLSFYLIIKETSSSSGVSGHQVCLATGEDRKMSSSVPVGSNCDVRTLSRNSDCNQTGGSVGTSSGGDTLQASSELLRIDKQKAKLYGSGASKIFEKQHQHDEDPERGSTSHERHTRLVGNGSSASDSSDIYGRDNDFGHQQASSEMTIQEKIAYLPKLSKYFMPLMLVYFGEYLINQGLFELIYYKEIGFLNRDAQYRWFQVSYQLGVLISRSSIECFRIKNIWLMSLLQLANAVIFLGHTSKLYHLPSFYLVVALIIYEGLLGGFTYVNTFHRIKQEVEPRKQAFCISAVTIADTIGIVMAGLVALPVHAALCKLYD